MPVEALSEEAEEDEFFMSQSSDEEEAAPETSSRKASDQPSAAQESPEQPPTANRAQLQIAGYIHDKKASRRASDAEVSIASRDAAVSPPAAEARLDGGMAENDDFFLHSESESEEDDHTAPPTIADRPSGPAGLELERRHRREWPRAKYARGADQTGRGGSASVGLLGAGNARGEPQSALGTGRPQFAGAKQKVAAWRLPGKQEVAASGASGMIWQKGDVEKKRKSAAAPAEKQPLRTRAEGGRKRRKK